MNFIKDVQFTLFGANLAQEMKLLSRCAGIRRLKIKLMRQYRNGVPVTSPGDLEGVQELTMLRGCQEVVVQQTAKIAIRQICSSRQPPKFPFTKKQVDNFAQMLREEICKERQLELNLAVVRG